MGSKAVLSLKANYTSQSLACDTSLFSAISYPLSSKRDFQRFPVVFSEGMRDGVSLANVNYNTLLVFRCWLAVRNQSTFRMEGRMLKPQTLFPMI